MTTKTGEALRGRKRPASVLEKAWATRRKNARAAKRAAKAAKKARGSRRHTRQNLINVTANRSKRLSDIARAALNAPLAQADSDAFLKEGSESMTSAIGASEADGANLVDPNAYCSGDDQLIREFISGIEGGRPHDACFFHVPRSAAEAVVRRLKREF